MAYKPALRAKLALRALNCTKRALREFLPPHYGSRARGAASVLPYGEQHHGGPGRKKHDGPAPERADCKRRRKVRAETGQLALRPSMGRP